MHAVITVGGEGMKCVVIHFVFHHNAENTQFDIKETERAGTLKKTSANNHLLSEFQKAIKEGLTFPLISNYVQYITDRMTIKEEKNKLLNILRVNSRSHQNHRPFCNIVQGVVVVGGAMRSGHWDLWLHDKVLTTHGYHLMLFHRPIA